MPGIKTQNVLLSGQVTTGEKGVSAEVPQGASLRKMIFATSFFSAISEMHHVEIPVISNKYKCGTCLFLGWIFYGYKPTTLPISCGYLALHSSARKHHFCVVVECQMVPRNQPWHRKNTDEIGGFTY